MRYKSHPSIFIIVLIICANSMLAQPQPYGEQIRINSEIYNYHHSPKIIELKNGKALLIWQSSGDFAPSALMGQFITKNGIFENDNFIITREKGFANLQWSNNSSIFIPFLWHSIEGGRRLLKGIVFDIAQQSSLDILPLPDMRYELLHSKSPYSILSLDEDSFLLIFTRSWNIKLAYQVYKNNGEPTSLEKYLVSENKQSWALEDIESLLLPNSNWIVSWKWWGFDGSGEGLFAKILDRNEQIVKDTFTINTSTAGNQQNQKLANLGKDKFIIVWQGPDRSDNGIYFQQFSLQGDKIGEETLVNKNILFNQSNPRILALESGDFLIYWLSEDQEEPFKIGKNIHWRLFDRNGVPIGSEQKVKTLTTLDMNPHAVQLANGKIVFVWQWSRYNDLDIWLQLVSQNGEKIGSQFLVNSWTAGTQKEPFVWGLNNGDFMVFWVSKGPDKSDYDIYMKRYPKEPIVRKLEKFNLKFPNNDITVTETRVRFIWAATNREKLIYPWEIQYYLYLGHSPDFESPQIIETKTDTSITITLDPGKTYFWKVLAKNVAGDSLWSSNTNAFFVHRGATQVTDGVNNLPEAFVLHQNYPNPFNPETTIKYELQGAGHVTIKIYDLTGRLVKVLVNQNLQPGAHSITWDGTDMQGRQVAAGIYLYQIKFTASDGKKWVQSKKMSLVK